MKRSIIHLDLDTFFVSCERLVNPELEGRPIILGGVTDRGIVSSCSYEARQVGIYANMPMKLARQICPEAVVIKGNSGIYSKFSNMVTDIIKEEAPLYEKASMDEFYIDSSGMDHYFGVYKWASELRERIIKETNLPISLGLSTNKTVSKVGTSEAKPNGSIKIDNGDEKIFLAPLSVRKIPMVGEKTYLELKQMGVERIETVQKMPIRLMESAFGENGKTIWKKCSGIDNTPVIPYNELKSISIERTFEKDTIDMNKINSIIVAMAENLAFQLRNGNKLTSCVAVKIKYADLNTYSKQKKIPYTAADSTILELVKSLFTRLYERRLRIRTISVRFSGLVEGGHQINFLENSEETCNLYQAMDKIRNRYGQDAVKRAIAIGSRGIGRTNPFTGGPTVIPAHRRA